MMHQSQNHEVFTKRVYYNYNYTVNAHRRHHNLINKIIRKKYKLLLFILFLDKQICEETLS